MDLPLGGYGELVPGLQLSLFTGWGVAAAYHAHLRIARHIMATGVLPDEERQQQADYLAGDHTADIDRRGMTDMDAYDAVITA